jgi:hypothetical protein
MIERAESQFTQEAVKNIILKEEIRMNTKKMIYNVTFFVLTFFVLSSPAIAATFYVDATNGKDANNGLSKTKAWKTIAKVNVSRFNPGDHILFKRGHLEGALK